jgi:hypothetical protein
MIKTGETLQERRVRHQKEYLHKLGDLSIEMARIQSNFYFRPGGLYEIDLERGAWDSSDRAFAQIPESLVRERLI